MSWLSSLKKKITFKGALKAVASVTKNIPLVGTAIGTIEGAVERAKSNAATAKAQTAAAGGAEGIVGNINDAAQSTKNMSTYLLIGGVALIGILVIVMLRK